MVQFQNQSILAPQQKLKHGETDTSKMCTPVIRTKWKMERKCKFYAKQSNRYKNRSHRVPCAKCKHIMVGKFQVTKQIKISCFWISAGGFSMWLSLTFSFSQLILSHLPSLYHSLSEFQPLLLRTHTHTHRFIFNFIW